MVPCLKYKFSWSSQTSFHLVSLPAGTTGEKKYLVLNLINKTINSHLSIKYSCYKWSLIKLRKRNPKRGRQQMERIWIRAIPPVHTAVTFYCLHLCLLLLWSQRSGGYVLFIQAHRVDHACTGEIKRQGFICGSCIQWWKVTKLSTVQLSTWVFSFYITLYFYSITPNMFSYF